MGKTEKDQAGAYGDYPEEDQLSRPQAVEEESNDGGENPHF